VPNPVNTRTISAAASFICLRGQCP
jgi:hypothetical protein